MSRSELTTPRRRATPPWDVRTLDKPSDPVNYYFAAGRGTGTPRAPIALARTRSAWIQSGIRTLRISFGAVRGIPPGAAIRKPTVT
ncbi:hypothetical protein [Thauera sinica]|uniref:Uncharacterized protein n=1 Tax=Thauera sinica TaxID=2665146 RepID=A0ABW1AVX0_9RHOO|nr:hypothetical protein [Thauera sp. K11]